MSDTRGQAPLETHSWLPVTRPDHRRYVVFYCDPAPKQPDPKFLGGERTRT